VDVVRQLCEIIVSGTLYRGFVVLLAMSPGACTSVSSFSAKDILFTTRCSILYAIVLA